MKSRDVIKSKARPSPFKNPAEPVKENHHLFVLRSSLLTDVGFEFMICIKSRLYPIISGNMLKIYACVIHINNVHLIIDISQSKMVANKPYITRFTTRDT